MTRLRVFAEGQTEEQFIKKILTPPLSSRGVWVSSQLLTTKRVKRGRSFTGGVPSYASLQRQIRAALSEDRALYLTTMLDLYALPGDYPGQQDAGRRTGVDKAIHLEECMDRAIGSRRFKAYIQVYEFEALVISHPDGFDTWFEKGAERVRGELAGVAPEEVNDSPQTAPSKRLKRLFPRYQKVLHGVAIAKDAELRNLLISCPHFADWYGWMQNV